MAFVYILKSEQTGRFYYGSTNDIKNRLLYHNQGKVKSTKPYRPWGLHYSEEYDTKSEAVKRELFFKSIDGYLWLKKQGIT